MSKQLVFHIGLHKTGTSFLQNNIFAYFENITLIRGFDSWRKIFNIENENEIFLLSDEYISGKLWGGNYVEDYFANLKMIQDLFGSETKIIVGFREPISFLKSIYKQYLHEGGTEGFETVYNPKQTGLIKDKDLRNKERIDMTLDLFENVLFYSQNELRNDEQIIEEICDFIGGTLKKERPIKENNNQGIRTNFQFKSLKTLNRFRFFKNTFIEKMLKRYKITFRQICQQLLRIVPSKEYEYPSEILKNLKSTLNDDWEYTQTKIREKREDLT